MKAFTLTEEARPGIRVFTNSQLMRPHALVGSGENSTPCFLDHDMRNLFLEAAQHNLLKYEPVTDAIEASLTMLHMKGSVVSRNIPSDRCAVLIETVAGVGGNLWYEAASYQETILQKGPNSGRVLRVYHPFPSPGIRVNAIGLGPFGEPQALITMYAGASFRICRTGDLAGQPTTLTVAWTGHDLYVRGSGGSRVAA